MSRGVAAIGLKPVAQPSASPGPGPAARPRRWPEASPDGHLQGADNAQPRRNRARVGRGADEHAHEVPRPPADAAERHTGRNGAVAVHAAVGADDLAAAESATSEPSTAIADESATSGTSQSGTIGMFMMRSPACGLGSDGIAQNVISCFRYLKQLLVMQRDSDAEM